MKNSDPEARAVKLIVDFANALDECKDIHEYYDLVVSVFIFNELVRSHVQDSFEEESDAESEIALFSLEEAGKIIARQVLDNNEVLRQLTKKNKKNKKTMLN